MSEYFRLLEHEVHIAALSFMGVAYGIRILWLFRFKPGIERSLPVGHPSHAVASSLLTVARPWTVEKYRRTTMFYAQFVIFHMGAAAAISVTFIIPYWSELLAINSVARSLQVILAAAFVAGMVRLYRRLSDPSLRLISTWDDYFSLGMMNLFYVISAAAISGRPHGRGWIVLAFFLVAAFFHVYVPFSKIIHYLYYPFVRYYLGKTMAHRGIGNGLRLQESSRRDKT